MIALIELPAHLEAQMKRQAKAALPRECCGLVEGVRDGSTARITTLYPTPNLAAEPDRFEIDPAAHITLLRELRGTGRTIIGCYHSHPNGRAEPSPRDAESAVEMDFLWLILALDGTHGDARLAAYLRTEKGFSPLRIETALA